MSEMALRSLIAHAVVDNNLCAKLLDGQREQVLEQFELSDSERCFSKYGRLHCRASLRNWMRG